MNYLQIYKATLVTHFLIMIVVSLDFHGQRMCQGHHPSVTSDEEM